MISRALEQTNVMGPFELKIFNITKMIIELLIYLILEEQYQ
jgi:hypothetical protein